MKPIGIVANMEKPRTPAVARALLRQLARLRQPLLLERGLARLLKRKGGVSLGALGRQCRLLVVLGGDGTVFRTAREIYPCETPILPVNLGTLGFLAAVSPSDLPKALPMALKGHGSVVVRSTLEASVHTGRRMQRGLVALNDVVIFRGATSRVVEIELRVDGKLLNSYICDGVIFSTPTGSTAYSLSAGGPVVLPGARVYVITPICPHTLTLSNRSVIVDELSAVEMKITRQHGELFLRLDGQKTVRLNPGNRVEVTSSHYKVRMITLPGGSFFELLRKKLRWGESHTSSRA